MNNNMNMINFNKDNLGMNIKNNINNNMNDIIKESNEKIIYVVFIYQNKGIKTGININQNKTINELLNIYRIRIGEDLDFFDKNIFLYNAKKINPNDNITIHELGLKNTEKIYVYLANDLVGGP